MTIKSNDKRIQALEIELATLKEKIKKTDAYLDNVMRVVPASIYWKDINSVILGSNLFHTKLTGFDDPQDVIGKTEHDFVWKAQAKDIIQNDKEIMALGEGVRLEETAILADGKKHTFLTSKEPLRDGGNSIIGIIGVSVDITEQTAAEVRATEAEFAKWTAEAKAASEEEMRKTVMVLVGDIVHDLRTPIATIRTATHFLDDILPAAFDVIDDAMEKGINPKKKIHPKKLNSIRTGRLTSNIKQAIKTMDDFINTSLLELTNAQKSISERFSSEDLIKCSSRRILENTLEAYSLNTEIKINQETSYDFFLMGNSILIMKVIFNLIRNASEQILHQGKGEIFIKTEEKNNVNLITVKDTAGGVEPDIEHKIFDDYFTTKKGGTGIGLSSARRLMANFGGELTFVNVPGDSIEFILSFPKVSD